MRRRKRVRRIFQYHVRNKLLSPEKFVHNVIVLFCLFRDEKQLLPGCPPLYQNKLHDQGVQDIVNKNKIRFEQCGDLVHQSYSQFNESSINNQDSHSQIENYETPWAKYLNENDAEDTEINKTSLYHKYYQMIKLQKGIHSLHSKQREVFNMVHTWGKDYVKYDKHDVELLHICIISFRQWKYS